MDHFETQRLEREAFQNAKEGDSFFVFNNYTVPSKAIVVRVTKTQIVIALNPIDPLVNQVRLLKDSGRIVGEGLYNRTFYRPALPHVVEEVEARLLCQKVESAKKGLLEALQTHLKKAPHNQSTLDFIDHVQTLLNNQNLSTP